jgi:hypothetical protein
VIRKKKVKVDNPFLEPKIELFNEIKEEKAVSNLPPQPSTY